MNKIEEEQENQAYLNAEARAEIKKQREAADIDEVRNIYNSFAVFFDCICDNAYIITCMVLRRGAEMHSKLITTKKFLRQSKRKKRPS